MNVQTDIGTCDIDLTAIMDRDEVTAIYRRRAIDDSWYFEVRLLDQPFSGYGATVGNALANARARNTLQVAA